MVVLIAKIVFVKKFAKSMRKNISVRNFLRKKVIKIKPLTIDNLAQCFANACINGANFVGVKIQMQGFEKPEIIINEIANFKTKFDYYKKAYNDDLTLKTFSGIKIIGFTYGDSFVDIEADLI